MTLVVMPQLGESIVEGTIVALRVRVGERVSRGQILAEVETDKATNEIPSPADGTVGEILAQEGETLEVGLPILRLDGPAVETPAQPSARLPTPKLADQPAVRTSPAVRRLAREHGVDLDRIRGSGRGGRITKPDILAQLERASVPPPIETQEATPFPTQVPAARPSLYRPPTYQPKPQDQVIPFSRRRTQIAEHMLYSQQTSAHVFAVAEIDMGRVERAKQLDRSRTDIKLTYLPYVVAAVARGLAAHPSLNATVQDRSLVLRADKNIGIAVDTPEGLIVPVIHRADELGILGIARRIADLAERAIAGSLEAKDVTGGSFSISNPGRKGNLYGASIIRQPEVAILRMGAAVKRPVVRSIDGEDVIVVRPMMYAALSYDHRVIDGRVANDFLYLLTELLQTQPAPAI